MKLKIEIGHSLCCALIKINGVEASEYEFGEGRDIDPSNAEDYGCGNRQWFPKKSTHEILEKYRINEDEYQEICKQLEEGLSFGCCGWCI